MIKTRKTDDEGMLEIPVEQTLDMLTVLMLNRQKMNEIEDVMVVEDLYNFVKKEDEEEKNNTYLPTHILKRVNKIWRKYK